MFFAKCNKRGRRHQVVTVAAEVLEARRMLSAVGTNEITGALVKINAEIHDFPDECAQRFDGVDPSPGGDPERPLITGSVPNHGGPGDSGVGSPSVTVNGGPLAFVAPLVATEQTAQTPIFEVRPGSSPDRIPASDIPVVPNAVSLGFSNVMVGTATNVSVPDGGTVLIGGLKSSNPPSAN